MSREIYRRSVAPHNDRVRIDGGTPSDNVQAAILLARDNAELGNDLKLFISPELTGYKSRIAAPYLYASKVYSMDGVNDLSQSTDNSQPYIDKIAPSESISLKNVNGDARYLSFNAIGFGATDKWTLEMDLMWNGNSSQYQSIIGSANSSIRFINNYAYQFSFVNESVEGAVLAYNFSPFVNKKTRIHFVANGDGKLNMYVNGIYVNYVTLATNFSFTTLFRGRTSYEYCTVSELAIVSQAFTSDRIAHRSALLKSIFTEIPSVQIGSLNVSLRAFESVSTPQGNNITEIQAAANAEKVINGDMTSWSGIFPNEIPTNWTAFGAHTANNYVTQSPAGKCRIVSTNGSAVGISQVGLTIGKMYKLTFDLVAHVSGALEIAGLVNAAFNTTQISVGTRTFYSIANAGSITFKRGTAVDFTIDNVSVQEVGWADSENLYNWIYANTSGTVEQKTLAALKAASLWCHHNNDVALGSIYGKIYNRFARDLIKADLLSSVFGFHIATEAELTTILSNGLNVKASGTNYWSTANGTQIMGLSLLGGAERNEVGGFGAIKSDIAFWCGDSNKIKVLLNSGVVQTYVQPAAYGAYLLLVKD